MPQLKALNASFQPNKEAKFMKKTLIALACAAILATMLPGCTNTNNPATPTPTLRPSLSPTQAVFFGKLIYRYKAGPKPYAHGAVRVFNERKPYYAALQPAQI